MKDETLDPETNPMIPFFEEPVDLDKVEIFDGSGLAPMMIVNPSPEEIIREIEESFTGQNEIRIGGRTLVLMADGNYTDKENGERLEEFSYGDLMKIYESITSPK